MAEDSIRLRVGALTFRASLNSSRSYAERVAAAAELISLSNALPTEDMGSQVTAMQQRCQELQHAPWTARVQCQQRSYRQRYA